MNIDINNYEEWFVAFIDNELSEQEINILNAFLASHPKLKDELAEYKELQFVADEEIIFEEKVSLLKKESPFIAWRKMWPLAAAVLLALVIIPFLRNDHETPTEIVKVNHQQENQIDSTLKKTKQAVPSIDDKPIQEEEKKTAVAQINQQAQQNNRRVIANTQKKTAIKKPSLPKQKKQLAPIIPQEPFDIPLKEVIVQEKRKRNVPEPKIYLPESKKETPENRVVKTPRTPEKKTVSPLENEDAILVISEDQNPIIYQKLNKVATKVEDKINTIKTIKKTPITVSIGKRKLFTLNN